MQFRTQRGVTPIAAPWDRVYSTGNLEDEPDLKSYLLSVKYDKLKRNARPLVKHMLSNLPAGFDAANYDVIMPVPLHRSRQKQRGGYNQSELLAKALAKHTGIPLETEVLRRGADRGQPGVNRQYRRQNLEQAFSVRNAERVYGKRALLLDDFISSGTTAGVASRKLRQAGASGVSVFTLARSGRDHAGGASTRKVGGVMNDFLGISLMSGRNTPKYPYPPAPQRTIRQDFDSQQLRGLPGYGVDTAVIKKIPRTNPREFRAASTVTQTEVCVSIGSWSSESQRIGLRYSKLRENETLALQKFERAVEYYNDSLTQKCVCPPWLYG